MQDWKVGPLMIYQTFYRRYSENENIVEKLIL